MKNRKLIVIIEEKAKKSDFIAKDELFKIVSSQIKIKEQHEIYMVVDELCKDNIISKYSFNKYKINNILPSFKKKMLDKYFFYFEGDVIDYDVSVWDSSWISKYSHLIPNKNFVIFECQKFATEHVINKLKEKGISAVFYKDLKTFSKYNTDRTIYVVKNFNEDAPIYRCKKKEEGPRLTQPKLEKMMVDIVSDSFLDEMLSNEIPHIYSELIKRYSINYSTLLRYAAKRNRQQKVLSTLKKANPEFERIIRYD